MEQTEAILIRKQAWSDTSLITTWLTSGHGKITAMARAARRPASPFAGRLDLFHKAEIGYAMPKRGSLHTLREVRLVEIFEATSASNLFLCGYFAELIDLVTQPGEPFPEIYDLFSRATAHLSRLPASMRALEFFESELCRMLGIHDGTACARAAIETYCGRIPSSRMAAWKLLNPRTTP
jgi:DNA repair protein RecO (recombination protein O)